jgi:hypothetical protein
MYHVVHFANCCPAQALDRNISSYLGADVDRFLTVAVPFSSLAQLLKFSAPFF